MKHIQSYAELQQLLATHSNIYLFLYKKGSQISDCAFETLSKSLDSENNILVIATDVNTVRDIHEKYGITSVPVLMQFENAELKTTLKGCNDEQFYRSVFNKSLYVAKEQAETPKQKQVTVYGTPTCSWCNTLKSYLNKHAIKYNYIDVSRDAQSAEAMVRKSGQQGVPQTDIEGTMIIGFDKNKINSMLGITE